MTRQAMEDALIAIEKAEKGHVYAARKGIVAATWPNRKGCVAFRRIEGGVQAETWPAQGKSPSSRSIDHYSIPADLIPRVQKMLDNL